MKRLVIYLALAVTAFAREIKLPSGHIINVMQVGPMVFTSGLPTAWVLQYATLYPLTAKKEIISEVQDIWTTFRLEVEKRNMKLGIIKVTGPSNGFVVQQRTEINFVFEPIPEGGWKMQLPDLMKEEKKASSPPPASH